MSVRATLVPHRFISRSSSRARSATASARVRCLSTASRARLRRARPFGPGRVPTRGRETTERQRELTREPVPEPGGSAGTAPTPGRAACRALTGGSLWARRRHQVSEPAPAGRQFPQQRAHGDRNRENRPSRPPRARHSLAAQRYRQGRAQGRVAVAMAQAPPLTLIFHGKTSAPIRRTGEESSARRVACQYWARNRRSGIARAIRLQSAPVRMQLRHARQRPSAAKRK